MGLIQGYIAPAPMYTQDMDPFQDLSETFQNTVEHPMFILHVTLLILVWTVAHGRKSQRLLGAIT